MNETNNNSGLWGWASRNPKCAVVGGIIITDIICCAVTNIVGHCTKGKKSE